MMRVCWCSCLEAAHGHNHDGTYCGRCKDCPHFRLPRERWYQFWRPPLRIPDTPAGLSLARHEEIR